MSFKQFYLISSSALDSITNENKCFFVIQGRQHRFLPEQPCRQPLKCVLGSLYFQKFYDFLFSLCFPEVHNPKVSRAKLSIVVRKFH